MQTVQNEQRIGVKCFFFLINSFIYAEFSLCFINIEPAASPAAYSSAVMTPLSDQGATEAWVLLVQTPLQVLEGNRFFKSTIKRILLSSYYFTIRSNAGGFRLSKLTVGVPRISQSSKVLRRLKRGSDKAVFT